MYAHMLVHKNQLIRVHAWIGTLSIFTAEQKDVIGKGLATGGSS